MCDAWLQTLSSRLSTLWMRARTKNCHQLTGTNFLKAGIWGDRREHSGEDVDKGAAGSAVKGSNLRNDELAYAST